MQVLGGRIEAMMTHEDSPIAGEVPPAPMVNCEQGA